MKPLRPRVIEPGYLWRWTKTGLALLGLNFHLWFGFALAFCGICFVLKQSYLLRMLVGIPFVLFSMEMAAYSTQRVVHFRDLRELFIRSAKGAWQVLSELRLLWVLALLLVTLDTAFWVTNHLLEHHRDYTRLSTWVFMDSPLAAALVGLQGALALTTRGTGFGTVVHPLREHYGLSKEQAMVLHLQAVLLNLRVSNRVLRLEFVVLFGLYLLLPVVAPLVLCLVPAMHYVMFKELFDPEGLPVDAPQPVSALAPSPREAY